MGAGKARRWGWGFFFNFDMNKRILTYTKSILRKKKKKSRLARFFKTILRAQHKKPPTLSILVFYNCFVVKVVIIH